VSKKPEGKYEPTLIYPSLIKGVAMVRRYGINKHGSSTDWRTTDPLDTLDAMGRHYFGILMGEELDPESSLPHLYHLGANVMFAIEAQYGSGFDYVKKLRKE